MPTVSLPYDNFPVLNSNDYTSNILLDHDTGNILSMYPSEWDASVTTTFKRNRGFNLEVRIKNISNSNKKSPRLRFLNGFINPYYANGSTINDSDHYNPLYWYKYMFCTYSTEQIYKRQSIADSTWVTSSPVLPGMGTRYWGNNPNGNCIVGEQLLHPVLVADNLSAGHTPAATYGNSARTNSDFFGITYQGDNEEILGNINTVGGDVEPANLFHTYIGVSTNYKKRFKLFGDFDAAGPTGKAYVNMILNVDNSSYGPKDSDWFEPRRRKNIYYLD